MLTELLPLLLLLLVGGLTLVALTVLTMARMLLRPKRMTDARAVRILDRLTPDDLGIEYEPVGFQVLDERSGRRLRLAAWWMPLSATTDRTVVLLHGYSDAKVGAIAWAPTWRRLGFNLLALDLRAHGDSQGVHSTAGFHEQHDVAQVIDELRATRPHATRQLLLFGVSLGAAVAVNVATRRDDLDGIVLECPFADYRSAIAAHAEVMLLPLPWLRPLAVRLAEWMSGADFEEVRPEQALPRARCPVLLIHSGDDPFVPRSDVRELNEAMARRDAALRAFDRVVEVEQAPHVMGITRDPEAYERMLREFVDGCLRRSGMLTPRSSE